MFEKLLLAATITFSMSLFIGTSQTTSLPSLAIQAERNLVKVAKLLPDRPLPKLSEPSTQLNQIELGSDLRP